MVTALVALIALAAGAALTATWFAVAAARRAVEARLAATDAQLSRLADAAFVGERGAGEMRTQVVAVRRSLELIQAREHDRREREEEAWDSLQRVTSLLAGSQRAGRAGENVLAESLSSLPPSILERDFRVNGRVVEFALVLSDGKRLPIDSKWPAEREVAQLDEATDPQQRERLVQVIERTVARRAREVAGYRDAAMTAPFVVAAIPDAAYRVLRRAHGEAFRHGVVVVPYSLALPIVLSLFTLAARMGDGGDVQACLRDLAAILDTMEATVENKLERAATMLTNGTGEVRGQIGQARTALVRARQVQATDEEGPFPRVVAGSG